jgi:hypothetical protein
MAHEKEDKKKKMAEFGGLIKNQMDYDAQARTF